jgi:rhodanese-related sulfurtransferase
VNAIDASKARADHHLLDVREDDEWQAGHIEGAQHIPLGQLSERVSELPAGRRIVAVCRSGGRSGVAVRGLRQLGHDAENLDGGVTAWSKAGLPLVDDAGRPGRVI